MEEQKDRIKSAKINNVLGLFVLFFGVVITAFSATIGYMESRSIPGFILLVLLFGIIIYFVSTRAKK